MGQIWRNSNFLPLLRLPFSFSLFTDSILFRKKKVWSGMEIILRFILRVFSNKTKGTFRIFLFFTVRSSIRIERRDSVLFMVIGGRKFEVGMEMIFRPHGCNCRRERDTDLISCNYS